MNSSPPATPRPSRAAIASVVVILAASGLAFGFSRALTDSLAWKRQIEDSVVNPTFLETAPGAEDPISAFTLPDRNGKPVQLSDFDGVDVLVVNIWSTGCPACEKELPSLAEMDRRIGRSKQLQLLTITTDASWEDTAHLFPRGTDLRILFDPEQKVTRGIFGTVRYPETFVLDKNRRIRARFDGEREWHAEEMLAFLTALR